MNKLQTLKFNKLKLIYNTLDNNLPIFPPTDTIIFEYIKLLPEEKQCWYLELIGKVNNNYDLRNIVGCLLMEVK